MRNYCLLIRFMFLLSLLILRNQVEAQESISSDDLLKLVGSSWTVEQSHASSSIMLDVGSPGVRQFWDLSLPINNSILVPRSVRFPQDNLFVEHFKEANLVLSTGYAQDKNTSACHYYQVTDSTLSLLGQTNLTVNNSDSTATVVSVAENIASLPLRMGQTWTSTARDSTVTFYRTTDSGQQNYYFPGNKISLSVIDSFSTTSVKTISNVVDATGIAKLRFGRVNCLRLRTDIESIAQKQYPNSVVVSDTSKYIIYQWLSKPHFILATAIVKDNEILYFERISSSLPRHKPKWSLGGLVDPKDPNLSFRELATYWAPVLWFSPDEPLRSKGPIPQPLPCDTTTHQPVVYYRVSEIHAAKSSTLENELQNNRLRFYGRAACKSQIILEYFFYYEMEEGAGKHPHDLEGVEYRINVDPHSYDVTREGICHYEDDVTLQLYEIVGKAHGLKWYDNRLRIAEHDSSAFPITILIEEGKHASCPDRNRDGYYTPGYDVNVWPNDAWGIRDNIRTSHLVSGNYQSWMTKIRKPEDKIFPPWSPENPKYELRPLPSWEELEAADNPKTGRIGSSNCLDAKNDEILRDKMAEKNAESKALPSIRPFERSWIQSYTKSTTWQDFSFGYRYDGSNGISLVLPHQYLYLALAAGMGFLDSDRDLWRFIAPLAIAQNREVPFFSGWLVSRLNVDLDSGADRIGLQFMYTPSASRFVDWYVGGGPESTSGSITKFLAEAGIRFRVNLPTPFGKRLFLGFRFGIRNDGLKQLRNTKFIFEIGRGVW